MNTHIDTVETTEQDERQDKGFTLVELLIVIVILGILATVTVFAVRGIQDRGEQSACEAEVQTVTAAAQAYYAQNNSYPSGVGELVSAGLLTKDAGYVTGIDANGVAQASC
jgi:general secretion pathway protein G